MEIGIFIYTTISELHTPAEVIAAKHVHAGRVGKFMTKCGKSSRYLLPDMGWGQFRNFFNGIEIDKYGIEVCHKNFLSTN